MDEKQFSYPLELGIAMFNGDGALKPDAYQALYMQAVEPHLMNIEMDEARLMRDYGVAWVLISMAVEMQRPVRPDDHLTAKTWNTTQKRRLLFRREMLVTDAAGETVFTAATFSTLLDLNARRVCTDRDLIAKFTLPAGETLMEASDRLRITTPEETDVICSAIWHHDGKAELDGPMDEILKDADVIDHSLSDPTKEVKAHEQVRYAKLREELGMAD